MLLRNDVKFTNDVLTDVILWKVLCSNRFDMRELPLSSFVFHSGLESLETMARYPPALSHVQFRMRILHVSSGLELLQRYSQL